MGIRRFTADADTTITNAFGPGLSEAHRGTGSNMGASDVLETFSIYAQGGGGQYSDASSGSVELSRILIKFPVSTISSSRDNGEIPASGSVSFYARMFNAKHAFTLPQSAILTILPISQSWDEGTGLDMEGYTDITRDFVGTNWINASTASSGLDLWANKGGSYHTASGHVHYTASFPNGDEDLDVDITGLVEHWLVGGANHNNDGKHNYGIGVYFTSSQEGYFSSSTGADTGSVLHNAAGTKNSYYTKKFFSRTSEYFFKRPCIEARWDSTIKDDRGSCYVSSSLVNASGNLNTIYLYNYVRGQLRNIPDVGQAHPVIFVQFYTSASHGELMNTDAPYNLRQHSTLGDDPPANSQAVTGGYVSTGIYSASFALNTSASIIYDRWFSGSAGVDIDDATVYYTGSIKTKQFSSSAETFNPNPSYVTKITNLKSTYFRDEEARFRVFVRDRYWNPNVYTTVVTTIDPVVIEKAYYKIFRVTDDLNIITYGTGSSTITFPPPSNMPYTQLSYDSNGNYFDLKMNMLEPDYTYGIKFAYYTNGAYREQPEIFKFRVE